MSLLDPNHSHAGPIADGVGKGLASFPKFNLLGFWDLLVGPHHRLWDPVAACLGDFSLHLCLKILFTSTSATGDEMTISHISQPRPHSTQYMAPMAQAIELGSMR
jgi:hypothetical protein